MFNLITKLIHFPAVVSQNDYYFLSKHFVPILSTYIQSRNTYILKRRYPVKLYRKGIDDIKLNAKDYVYDLVQDTDTCKKPDVQVILRKYIEGLGHRGDIVTVKRNVAYNTLLVTGLADYATPEAIEKANLLKDKENKDIESYSSLSAMMAASFLESQVLSVVMNREVEWTLQPWHVRVSFRKAGIQVPEHCIMIPSKPISGPDAEVEGKEFYVTVTINKKEKANVRCRIRHWSTNPADRLPYVKDHWQQESEPIFSEDAEVLSKLKLPSILKNKNSVKI